MAKIQYENRGLLSKDIIYRKFIRKNQNVNYRKLSKKNPCFETCY